MQVLTLIDQSVNQKGLEISQYSDSHEIHNRKVDGPLNRTALSTARIMQQQILISALCVRDTISVSIKKQKRRKLQFLRIKCSNLFEVKI